MTADNQMVERKPAPDGGYGWVVLISSFFISFVLDGVMYSFGVILGEIKQTVDGVEEDVFNLLSSFNTGFLFCSGPIVAGLANQFGCRAVVMGGAVVTATMYILTALSQNIYFMLTTYGFIGGISTGCTYIASLIIIADYFDKKRGVATGICMAGSGVGSFVSAPLIGLLIQAFDWKFCMSVCACVIFQTCVCGALLRPLNPTSSNQEETKMKNFNEVASELAEQKRRATGVDAFHGSVYSLNKNNDLPFHQRNSFLRIVTGILKEMTDFKLITQNFAFFLITASNFFLFTGYFTPFIYLTEIAQKNEIDKESATYLLSTIGIVNIPARMLYGLIADRKYISAVNLNTFSVAVATVSLFLFPILQHEYWSLIVFSVIFAVGIAGMNSLTTVYLCELVGLEKFGNATGIINLFRGFGCFLGPFVAGFIKSKCGLIHTFSFSSICFVVGLALSILVSFTNMIRGCLGKNNNENVNQRTADESEINKNLIKA